MYLIAKIFNIHDKINFDKVPNLKEFLLQFILKNIISEIYWFFLHKHMHNSSLIKFHKIHHYAKYPLLIIGSYSHPYEFILGLCFPLTGFAN